jgi:uncharacterized protein YbjT (DUF2867 family)
MQPDRISVIVSGTSGMVGGGVLRECLEDRCVAKVTALSRTPSGLHHEKFEEIIHSDFSDFSSLNFAHRNYDACFFCLGVSSAGLTEPDYRRVTYDYTLSLANTLVRVNPNMTFVYVSGAGTDSSGTGRIMWARVKGQTENALLALPFAAAYMLRPGIIQPLDGIKSKTPSYRLLYSVLKPFLPMLRAALPNHVLSTAQIGLAMLNLAKRGYPKRVLETVDIRAAAAGSCANLPPP